MSLIHFISPFSSQKKVERINSLSFLDIHAIRMPSGLLETTVYQKTCDTGTFLHFNSRPPTEHKRSVVRSLMKWSQSLPSNLELKLKEQDIVLSSLCKCCYPQSFINGTSQHTRKPDISPPHPPPSPKRNVCPFPTFVGSSKQ